MQHDAIQVKNVSKSFKLPHEKNSSIKGLVINFYQRKKGYEVQETLKNITFTVKKGEFFAIVGRNGSGKSTLLKLLAGIYSADTGSIGVNGRLTPFIELGVGFSPELSGRDNVYLNGALLGFSRKEMEAMYNDIVSFAELERFMDQKLKNYSSGMQVRLAFSIAIRARSDILVLDEVLAVGDADFQQKCFDYFNSLKRQGATVVLVTHDMSAVRRFCDRAVLINKGRLEFEGSPDEAAARYEVLNLRNAEKRLEAENTETKEYKQHESNGDAEIVSVETFDVKTGSNKTTFTAKEKIAVRIKFKANKKLVNPGVGFILQDDQNTTVFATNNSITKQVAISLRKDELLVMETIIDNIFTNGQYTITCAIESSDFKHIYDRIEHIQSFLVGGHKLPHAATHPSHSLRLFTEQA